MKFLSKLFWSSYVAHMQLVLIFNFDGVNIRGTVLLIRSSVRTDKYLSLWDFALKSLYMSF